MKRLEKIVTVLVIIALLGALASTLNTYIQAELWGWYDAGYDDALEDLGIVYINGELYLEDCLVGYSRTELDRSNLSGYNIGEGGALNAN